MSLSTSVQGTGAPRRVSVPPWMLALGAMLCVQVSNALSVPLIEAVGPYATGWLRFVFGAVVLALVVRPKISKLTRGDLPILVVLGVTTGFMVMLFLCAIERIPLGTAVAVEFVFPLLLAGILSPRKSALVWPALAFVGVVLITEPWHGQMDAIGLLFAVASGICWAGYNFFTQRVGDRYTGVSGLALTLPIAAVATMPFGLAESISRGSEFPWWVVPAAAGVAIITPCLAFSLEMLALKRMTQTAFGTLLSIEPGIATVVGLVGLMQAPAPLQLAGIALVVLAGCAAQRGGSRGDVVPLPPQPD